MRFSRANGGILIASLLILICILLLASGEFSSGKLDEIDLSGFQIRKHEHKIDLNRATAAELKSIEGIGSVLAKRIIQYRLMQGPLSEYSELDEIKGIGPALLKGIQAVACLGNDCTE